jgi:NADP-dependent 3-hydroxy acid dehydrogenase YdfG
MKEMIMEMDGKTTIVTGAGSGIGDEPYSSPGKW